MAQDRSLSVLVVDSDPFMGEIFGLILAHYDVPHHIVQDAEAALAYLRHHPVAVVIVDCSAPEGDSGALARQIRDGNLAPGAKLVATSIFEWDGTQPEALQWDFDGFIPKPFDINDIVPYLRGLVQDTTGV